MKHRKHRKLMSWVMVFILVLNILLPAQATYAGEIESPGEAAASVASPSEANKGTPSTAEENTSSGKANSGEPKATPSSAGNMDKTDDLYQIVTEVTQNGVVIPEGGEINSNAPISVDISFYVPVEGDEPVPPVIVNKNDVAIFEISDAFKLLSGTAIPLKYGNVLVGHVMFFTNTDNVVCAKVVFDGDDEVFDGTYNTVQCEFHAEFQFDSSESPVTGEEKTVGILDKEYTVVVPPAKIIYNVKKQGTLDLTNQWVTWKVDITADQGGYGIDLEGYKFSDDLSSVGTYILDSFQVDGDTSAVPEINDGVLAYTFPAGAKSPQTVIFKTEISEEQYYAPSGEQSISNKASLYDKDDTIMDEGQTKVSWTPKWIEKSGVTDDKGSTGVYDPQNRTITWTIIANHNEASLKQVVITDILSKDITNTEKKLIFDSATLQKWDGSDFGAASNITPNENGEYEIGDIDTKILLKIVTRVPDEVLTTGKTTYYNQASIKWEGTQGSDSNKVGVGIGYNAITKTGTAHPSDGTVTWNVTVDPKKQTIPDPKVYDVLIYGNKASGSDLSAVSGLPDNIEAKDLKISYGLKYMEGTFHGDGLVLQVIPLIKDNVRVGDLLEITGILTGEDSSASTFTYKTQVTDPDIFATNKSTVVYNTATLFSGSAKLNESTAVPTYNSKMLMKEMLKREAMSDPEGKVNASTKNAYEGFDYTDKSVIFRFGVNANNLKISQMTDWTGQELGAVTVKDTLPEGWIFDKIDGSNDFLIFEGIGNNAGSVTANGPALPSVPGFSFTIQGREATFEFQNMDRPYVILIKARPDTATIEKYFSGNQTTTVQNNLSLVTNRSPEVTSTQNVEIVSEILGKSAEIKSQGVLLWSVDYKPSQLTTSAKRVYDILPQGIDIRLDSKGKLLLDGENYTANEMILQADGSYTLGDPVELIAGETIDYDNAQRGLSFQIPDSRKAYRFCYMTDVTGEPGTVSNKVTLYGGNSDGTEASKPYLITSQDGQASMKRNGWISIIKTDMAGIPLKNAEFTLFTEDESTIIRKGMTNSDGTLKFKVIPNGTYVLRETLAPSGYVLEGVSHTLSVTSENGAIVSSIDGKRGNDSNVLTVKNISEGTAGNLKISKTIAGNAADLTYRFDFTVTLDGDGNSYPYKGYGVPDGMIKSGDTISLAHGESIIIQGIPVNTNYLVAEKDYSDAGYTTVSTGEQGSIEADAVQTASFTNTRNVIPPEEVLTGNLTISKTVSGSGADTNKKFGFTVSFDGADGKYTYTGMGVADGTIKSGDQIFLAHGQSITISGLPDGAGYSVLEEDYSTDGYKAVSAGAQGSIQAKTTQVSAYTNTKPADPKTPVQPGIPGGGKSDGGGSGDGNSIKVEDTKVPKSIIQNPQVPAGNQTGSPESIVIDPEDVPKGAKTGKNERLPKTGEAAFHINTIIGVFLILAGMGALFLSLLLFRRKNNGK